MDGKKWSHCKVLPFSWRTGLAEQSEGRSISCNKKKEKSDACVGGIRVLEPESVLFLEIFSLLPMLPVFMLYR